MNLEDIKAGMSAEEVVKVAAHIRSVMEPLSVTNLQPQVDALAASNLDPRLKAERDAQALREQQSAPPPVPDRAAGMSDQQWNAALEKHATETDQYHLRLMERKPGVDWSASEKRSLASAALSALRESGIRT